MITKEICENLWQTIIDECDKQISKYKELNKKAKDNLKKINEKSIHCTKCEENLKKQYNDMIITCAKSINTWKKQKEKAIKSKKNCSLIKR